MSERRAASPMRAPGVDARPAAWLRPGQLAALMVRLRAVSAATWFLVLAAPVALFLVFAVPPFQGLDEGNHFARVYSITSGTLIQPIQDDRAGTTLPACVYEYTANLWAEGTRAAPFDVRDFWTVPAGCGERPPRFWPIENTAVYSPVCYLPQIVGVGVARLLGASLPIVFYSGRLAGALGFIGLVFLALRLTPRAHAVILVIASLPMVLLLGSAYSADGMTIASSLLTIALVLRCRFDPNATWRDFVLAATAALALALSKNAYGLFALLLVLVPARLFPSRRVALAARAGALLAIALAAGLWYLKIRNVSMAATGYGPIVPAEQVQFVVQHPLRYLRIVARTLFGPALGYYLWPGIVSWVGFGRSTAAGSPLPPPIIFLVGFALLLVACKRAGPGPYTWTAKTIAQAAVPAAVFVGTVAVIVSALYIEITAVGAPGIAGIQGRYFLPLAGLPATSLTMLVPGRLEPRSMLALLPFILLLLVYLTAKVVAYFY